MRSRPSCASEVELHGHGTAATKIAGVLVQSVAMRDEARLLPVLGLVLLCFAVSLEYGQGCGDGDGSHSGSSGGGHAGCRRRMR